MLYRLYEMDITTSILKYERGQHDKEIMAMTLINLDLGINYECI